MQNWGHFEISCITNFNKIDSGTLIFFGTNMSIFGGLKDFGGRYIRDRCARGPKKFFLRYTPIDVSNIS